MLATMAISGGFAEVGAAASIDEAVIAPEGAGAASKLLPGATKVADTFDPSQIAGEENSKTVVEWAVRNESDIADSIESTSTAFHYISPAFPVVPSATGGSVVVGAIVTVVIAQKIAQLIGG
jgi:hypothetical protein